jgi:hypothetical protein
MEKAWKVTTKQASEWSAEYALAKLSYFNLLRLLIRGSRFPLKPRVSLKPKKKGAGIS